MKKENSTEPKTNSPRKRKADAKVEPVEEKAFVSEAETFELVRDMEEWPKKAPKEVKEKLKVVRRVPNIEEGLSTEEVEARIESGMGNAIKQGSSKTISGIIIGNTFTFFNLLNFSIGAWLLSVGAYLDMVFLLIVTSNLIIGIFQEIKAKKTIDSLSLISAPVAVVIRDKEVQEIPISDLVLDDILLLSSGKQICSDAIVLENIIEVDESLLTGESDPVIKKPGDNLFSGSFVISGTCKAIVDKVGADAYIQKLTSQAKKYVKPKSDLLKSLKLIIRIVAIIIIPMGMALYFLQNNNSFLEPATRETIIKTSGAMIGMIPSGLFLLTSITLAVGLVRLGKINTLVQELYCIEMLARVNVLCLDKTGTITDGTMTVNGLVEYPNEAGMKSATIISTMITVLDDQNLTSVALEQKFGKSRKVKALKTLSFSSARKFSAIELEKYGVFLMGAPEIILKDNFHLVEKDVDKYAAEGLRVLLLAYSKGKINKDDVSGEILPVSLILIEDTIRKEAITTINYFNTHGVKVRVISGDNPMTVAKVAERAGVIDADKFINLDGMTDKEVIKAVDKYAVFGRVTPNQKKLIIQTLKKNKNTVAMTGDGVNDILALKEADCSIAMASGSEAARNVSHLVLLDSNFASLPRVVNEGRRVINNVQRVSTLFLTKTIFSFLLALIALSNNGRYPISPSQLILIDLLVIGIPSLVLAIEPNNRQVKGKFLLNVLKNALPGALTIVVLTLIIYALKEQLGLFIVVEDLAGGETVIIDKTPTLIVICATFTCMMVLKKVCSPFNIVRKMLFGIMFLLFIVCALFLGMFFDFHPFWETNLNPREPLDLKQIIFLICLVQASSLLIKLLSNVVPWCRKQINFLLNSITQI
ncbi:MAG: cation-translocating P-type ATPase [Erysipelotrichales bacterium]|nr:cation-translocating P-type ATPase [Erysipelotrichales bacterium]